MLLGGNIGIVDRHMAGCKRVDSLAAGFAELLGPKGFAFKLPGPGFRQKAEAAGDGSGYAQYRRCQARWLRGDAQGGGVVLTVQQVAPAGDRRREPEHRLPGGGILIRLV